MIYCREKLVDIMLESAWISLEDRFDFEITLEKCLKSGHFSAFEWDETEKFLNGVGLYSDMVYKVITVLMNELGYTDETFLREKEDTTRSLYTKLEKGVRL